MKTIWHHRFKATRKICMTTCHWQVCKIFSGTSIIFVGLSLLSLTSNILISRQPAWAIISTFRQQLPIGQSLTYQGVKIPTSITIIMTHHHHHPPPPHDHQRCVPRSSDRLYLRIGLLVGYAQLVRIGIFLCCFFPTRFLVLLELLMISLYKRQSLMIFFLTSHFYKILWGNKLPKFTL